MKLGLSIGLNSDTRVKAGGGVSSDPGVQADIVIVRRSQLQIAPEGLIFEVSLSGFDCTGPTGNGIYDDRLHEIYYYWDFGDSYTFAAPSNVLTAHKNANVAYGPKASHTFRAAGTYTISCLVVEPSSGKSVTGTLDITIEDPNTRFSGANTLYVAPDSVFTGKPSGAKELTSLASAISDVMGQDTTPKRIMLKRGQSYSLAFTTLGDDVATRWPSVHIVAESGAGAKPVVTVTGGFFWNDSETTGDGNDKDLTFQNIVWNGPWDSTNESGTKISFFFSFASYPYMILTDLCEFAGFDITFFCGSGEPVATSETKIINDSLITDWGRHAIFDWVPRETVITGSRLAQHVDALSGGPKDGTHNDHGPIRMVSGKMLLLHSSDFFSRCGWFPNIPTYVTEQPCIRFNTTPIADAQFYAHTSVFEGGVPIIHIAPQNNSETNLAVNCIVAMNYLMGSHWTASAMEVHFGGTTIRNNVMVFPDVAALGPDFDPRQFVYLNWDTKNTVNRDSEIRVYNNTFINLLSAANYVGTEMAAVDTNDASGFTNLVVGNNLIHQPNLTSPITTNSPLNSTMFFTPRQNGYISDQHPVLLSQYATPPNAGSIFIPLSGSAALGAALTEPIALDDFFGVQRPIYSSIGALEMQ